MVRTHRKLAGMISAAAGMIAGVLLFRHYWLTLPVGSGPAGPPVSPSAFHRVWTRRPVLLLGLGDSITAGFGADIPSHAYFRRLADNPPDEFPELRGLSLRAVLPHLKTLDLAVSGSTSAQHFRSQASRIPASSRETLGLVVITTGGNDLIHNYGRTTPRRDAMYGATMEEAAPWVGEFAGRLDALIARIDRRFPGGCQIFLANIYDPTDGVGAAWSAGLPAWPDSLRILQAYNGAIRRCVLRHSNVHLVDIHAAFLGHGIYCRQFWRRNYQAGDPHYWYYQNFEDPNDRGHDAIRRLFLREIVRVMSPLSHN